MNCAKKTRHTFSFAHINQHIMKHFFTFLSLLALLLIVNVGWGQTNPAAQSLPYSQNFDALAHSSTTYPAGWQGWTISTSPGSSFNTAAPTADRALTASSTAATNSGNVHNYNSKIGFLNTGSLDLSITLAINTIGKESVSVSYEVMTIRNPYDGGSNTRINELTLQYRIGTSGAFTNLTGIEYQNNTSTQTTAITTPQNLSTRNITLPSACNNQAVVQLRWVSREVSGVGSRPSFAVDNISITADDIATPLINVSPTSLAGFTYIQGSGPSIAQSFTISGTNLTDNISIAASTNYEISLSEGSGYMSPINLTHIGGSVGTTTIYVRLKAGLSAGTYNSEVITASSNDASDKTVTCSGNVTLPPQYFRSKASNNWSNTDAWQSSSDGNTWEDATNTPTSNDFTITIRNGHTITINASVTLDEVVIESGGILSYTAGTLTVANGTGHDIQINDGGIFALSLASTPPSFNTDATCLISTGGVLRVTATGLTGNGAGVNLSNFIYQSASILEYTSTSTFIANGVTFFPNADVSTIPIFRITALTASPGGTNNTVINGIVEANSSFTWTGTGTKTFRNGIRGTGTMTQGTNGQWIISGSTAELNGSGALSLGTNGLVINSGSTVTASSTKSISDGTVTNNGILNVTSDGALSMSALTNSATGAVNITGSLTVEGTLSNSGTLIIKSNATGTGSLIHSSSGVSATVERYVVGHANVAADGWHLMGSPVATFDINGSSFDPGANDDLYSWDEATNTWLNHKAGNPTQIVPGTGYLVAYENTATKSFTGNLNVSNVSVSGLTHNASQGKGWHLLGNPFASALEWNKTGGSWALTNIAATAKVWNSGSKAYDDIDANGIIPAAQGFFVQVNESTTGSLTIPAAARAHSGTAWYKSTTPRILLSASPADGSSKQESQIRIEPEATTGFDFYHDSRFLEGYAPKFYSVSGGEMLSTNALPQLQDGTSIPFGFVKNQHNAFVIRLEENMPATDIYLKDLKLNLAHHLSQQTEYYFTAAEGDEPNRFLLHFGVVGITEKPSKPALHASVAAGQLHLLNLHGTAQLDIFDLSGRLLQQHKVVANGKQSVPLALPAGVYVVLATGETNSEAVKVIVQ